MGVKADITPLASFTFLPFYLSKLLSCTKCFTSFFTSFILLPFISSLLPFHAVLQKYKGFGNYSTFNMKKLVGSGKYIIFANDKIMQQ